MVATRKYEGLEGVKFLVVQPLTKRLETIGEPVVAAAALENAEQELHRQRELVANNLSAQRLLDQAVAARDQAAARLAANREALGLAIEGARREDISAAQAALAAALARREQAQTRLQDTHLHAPSAGTILTRASEPGAMLGVGVPAYTLSLTETVYVRAYVDEPNLGRLAPGAKVIVKTDSSDKLYLGQVGFISPRAEFTPKTVETPSLRTDLVYRLRIVVDNPDQGLRQGMPITVEIATIVGTRIICLLLGKLSFSLVS